MVFPQATLEELGIEAENATFKIGTEEGKRKIKSLYLIPTEDPNESFAFEKAGRGSVIPLSIILKNGGVDFETVKHTFSVTIFNYIEGIVGYELELLSTAPKADKPAYTGKPRGRRPKTETADTDSN